MIHDPLLRWVVTGLFALGAFDCAMPIFTRRIPWAVALSQGLHLAMAVAMATMAWPWSAQLPTAGPAALFLAATSWFAVMGIGVTTAKSRALYGYHTLMMLATAWMYFQTSGALPADHSGLYPSASIPGMNMAAPDEPTSSGMPTWVGSANWLGTIVFTFGAVFWARRSACCRSLGNLAQLAIAAGTAILFVSMIFRI